MVLELNERLTLKRSTLSGGISSLQCSHRQLTVHEIAIANIIVQYVGSLLAQNLRKVSILAMG